MNRETLTNIFNKCVERFELKRLIKEEILKAANENIDNKIIEFKGKLGFWSKNEQGKPYFQEVELKNNLYYLKGKEQVYVPHSEYQSVLKGISPENLSRVQFESDEFSKEINGILYHIKKTDEGWIPTGRINKRNDSNKR